jgi:hypothetical protein
MNIRMLVSKQCRVFLACLFVCLYECVYMCVCVSIFLPDCALTMLGSLSSLVVVSLLLCLSPRAFW